MKPPRTALVTGANRGIGLEVCRQLASLGAALRHARLRRNGQGERLRSCATIRTAEDGV
jgi:NAD(P)-dependent dehydrogenase (short-subunit alcohol dehydrogenase family)